MIGQGVVEHRLKEPRTQLDHINRGKVETCLNGVKDGAQGRGWCLASPVLARQEEALSGIAQKSTFIETHKRRPSILLTYTLP